MKNRWMNMLTKTETDSRPKAEPGRFTPAPVTSEDIAYLKGILPADVVEDGLKNGVLELIDAE